MKTRLSHFIHLFFILLLLALNINATNAQGILANGGTYGGTIAPIGDSDTWTFSATKGDSIIIKVGRVTQTNNFNPRIRLLNPASVQQALASSTSAAEIAVTATNTGTFTVIVDDAHGTSATGTYVLTLAKTGSPIVVSPGDEGGPMTNGVVHQGNLPVGDLDLWNFTANAGDSIVLKMGQTSDTNNFDPWIRLYGPDGALVASSTDTAAAEVTIRATNSGTFLVVVANNPYYSDAAGGTYVLTLAKTGSPIVVSPGDEGGPMTNGVVHQGNLPVGDLDLWNFTANAGDSIVLKMGQTSDTNNFDPWIRLYGPDGALVASSTDTAAAEVTIRATNSGTFLVVVANNPYYSDAAGGTYVLTLAKTGSPIVVSPGDEGGPMTNGVVHQGNLPVGDLDLWNFTANAGDSIVLKMGQTSDTNNFDPWIRLYGPDGALVASSTDTAAAEVTIRATNSGTFLVVVANNPYYSDAAGGTYVLTLAKTGSPIVVSPGDEGGPMTNGVVHQGNLPVGDLDLWNFAANAGDSIVLKMGQTSDTNNFDPWIRLYGPDGALVASSTDTAAAEVTIRATNSGTFLVVVANNPYYSDAAGGTYVLTLAKTGSPIVVSPGDEGGSLTGTGFYNGNLPIGGVELWTFTICAGELMDVRADETTQTNTFDPWVRVYGPTGALIGSNFGTTFGEVTLTATNGGRYLVLISNNPYNNDAGSGTYQLTVNGLSDGFKICSPVVSGSNVNVGGVGGIPGTNAVLFTTTNIATPVMSWTPIRTNSFDQFGVFLYTNGFNPAEQRRFYRLGQP